MKFFIIYIFLIINYCSIKKLPSKYCPCESVNLIEYSLGLNEVISINIHYIKIFYGLKV